MMTYQNARLALLVVSAAVASSRLEACSVCLPCPTQSAADYLIESEFVAFVRQTADAPWHRLCVADVELQQIVQRIIVFSNEWSRTAL
jgi:hypothetical protein